jgi:hypothetical protein
MQLATADPAAPAFWSRDQELNLEKILNPFWPKSCKLSSQIQQDSGWLAAGCCMHAVTQIYFFISI